jgi:hypothetical protein
MPLHQFRRLAYFIIFPQELMLRFRRDNVRRPWSPVRLLARKEEAMGSFALEWPQNLPETRETRVMLETKKN